MKRFFLSLFATVGGLAALLSFKTQTHPLATGGPLPSAGLPAGSTSSLAPSSSPPSSPTPGARPSTSTSSTSAPAPTRSYLGAAVTTQYGIVQVKVTVRGTRIVNVSFAQLTAFDGHSADINAAAAPTLLQETLSAQSAHIDTVSGATYTSEGYLQSLQSALDAAGIH